LADSCTGWAVAAGAAAGSALGADAGTKAGGASMVAMAGGTSIEGDERLAAEKTVGPVTLG
jgi:hypothetical protein